MIVVGLVLLVLGLALNLGALMTIGVVVLLLGLVPIALHQAGRPVGGRKHWF